MSAELAPTSPSPAHARDLDPRPIDVLRDRELTRRMDAGQTELEAWSSVATDGRIGLMAWRGKDSLPVAAAVRSYARFLRRMAPSAVEDARLRAERAMARTAIRNVTTIQAVADGTICGTAENSGAAKDRLAGAREALKIVGIGADKQTRVTTNVGVGVSFGDLLRSPIRP